MPRFRFTPEHDAVILDRSLPASTQTGRMRLAAEQIGCTFEQAKNRYHYLINTTHPEFAQRAKSLQRFTFEQDQVLLIAMYGSATFPEGYELAARRLAMHGHSVKRCKNRFRYLRKMHLQKMAQNNLFDPTGLHNRRRAPRWSEEEKKSLLSLYREVRDNPDLIAHYLPGRRRSPEQVRIHLHNVLPRHVPGEADLLHRPRKRGPRFGLLRPKQARRLAAQPPAVATDKE